MYTIFPFNYRICKLSFLSKKYCLDEFLKTFDFLNDDISEFYSPPKKLKQLQSIDYFAKTMKPVKEVWKILKQIKDSREKINKILKANDITHENIPTTLFSS